MKPVFSRAQQTGSQPRSYLFYVHLLTPWLGSPACVRTSGSLEVAVNRGDLLGGWWVGISHAKRARGQSQGSPSLEGQDEKDNAHRLEAGHPRL